MAKRLKIIDSAKAAYRQSWRDRRDIFLVSWLTLLLGFGLMTLPVFFPAAKYPAEIGFRILFPVIAVGLLRKDILGERPDIKKIAGVPLYFRFCRREALYAVWNCAVLAVFYITGKIGMLTEYVPLVGVVFSVLFWPLMRDLLLSMLVLVRPYIAVAPNPSWSDFTVLVESTIGNIANILMATLTIMLPDIILTQFFHVYPRFMGFHAVWHYAEHAVYCLCLIVELKFIGMVYQTLYAPQPPASRPR